MTNPVEIVQMMPLPDGVPRVQPELKDGAGDRTRKQLDRILHSKTFQRATRLRSLLEYVVTAASNGQVSGQSKTARELFGKGDDFDPSLDPVIRVQFGRLRRALAAYYATEGRKDSIVIEVPNRKYTPIIKNVTPVDGQPGPAPGVQTPAYTNGAMLPPAEPVEDTTVPPRTERALIAVLPFANLTTDPSQDSFCYGLTEEIANRLAAAASVDVVASSSTFQFKDDHFDVREVGRELGVPLILEGSVRMEGGRTRVIAQLARSKDGVALWSDSFEDQLEGSLDTQKSIADQVMKTLPLNRYEV